MRRNRCAQFRRRGQLDIDHRVNGPANRAGIDDDVGRAARVAETVAEALIAAERGIRDASLSADETARWGRAEQRVRTERCPSTPNGTTS